MSVNLASASDCVKIWEVSSAGECTLKSQTSKLCDISNSLSWNHTNQVLAHSGNVRSIKLIQSSNGVFLSSVPFTESGIEYEESVVSACFSSNSRYLACGIGKYAHLWDLKKHELKFTSDCYRDYVTVVSTFSEGNLAVGDKSGCLRFVDMKTGKSSSDIVYKDGCALNCFQVSGSTQSRIVAGYQDGYFGVYDIANGKLLNGNNFQTSSLSCLSVSPVNSRLVVTSGINGKVILNDITSSTGSPTASIDIGDRVHCVSFHENGLLCAVGTNSGHILMYDWRNCRSPISKTEGHAPFPIYSLCFQVINLISLLLLFFGLVVMLLFDRLVKRVEVMLVS